MTTYYYQVFRIILMDLELAPTINDICFYI